MILVPTLEQYGPDDPCRSRVHHTIGSNDPSQITLQRGEGDIPVKLTIPFGAVLGPGYVSARASFWSGFDAQGPVMVNSEEVWSPTTTCFAMRP